MTKEILRDKTLDWLDVVLSGATLKKISWAIIALAVLYFSPFCIRILAR